MVLGVTVLAEVAGKSILNNGLTTQLRPRNYYTIPRETLDALIGDVHELVNFVVIEVQRILFAENVPISAAVRIVFLAFAFSLLAVALTKNYLRLPLELFSHTTLSRSSPTGALP